MNRKLSSALLTALLVFSALAVGGAGTAAAANESLDSPDEPLKDGDRYWQGQQLYNDTIASPNETLKLYNATSDEFIRNVTADNSGMLEIDTSDLEANSSGYSSDYYLQNASGDRVVNFSLVEQTLSFASATRNYYYITNGTAEHVEKLGMDSNRAGYDLVVESPSLNLTKRIDGAQRVDGRTVVFDVRSDIAIDSDGLESDSYRINASAADTTAETNFTFRPSNISEVRWELHQMETVNLTDGETYWAGRPLRRDYGVTDERLEVVTADDGTYVQELLTNDTGVATFDTKGWGTRAYDVRRAYPQDHYVTFNLTAQTLSTSFTDATVTQGNGTTNLSVTSNRSDYDLLLWTENVSRASLNEAIPASTVTSEGDLVVQNLSTDESLTVNYSSLPTGTYTLYVSANGTEARSNTTLTVEEKSQKSGGNGNGNTGGGGSGGGGGGDVPPPAVQVEVVEEGDNFRRVKVTSARADSPASVSLPGFGTPDATFHELTIAPESSDAEPRFFLNSSVVSTPAVHAPADVETLGYLHVKPTYIDNGALESVTVTFRVASDAAEPEEVVLHRYVDGVWKPLSTEFVGERDGDYAFRAEATGVSLFAVTVDDSKSLGDDAGAANETTTADSSDGETSGTTSTAATGEESAIGDDDESATRDAEAATTGSSGPVGHDAWSVLGPLVALVLALAARTRQV